MHKRSKTLLVSAVTLALTPATFPPAAQANVVPAVTPIVVGLLAEEAAHSLGPWILRPYRKG